MEISWKCLNLCLGLLFFELCNGFPINLENTVADQHTQLLTGLVAVLLTVCSVVLLAGCLCCRHKNGFKEFRDSPVVASAASNLDHGHVNPIANGEFTIFTPLSPPHYNNNVFLANEQIISRTSEDYVYGDIDVSSWFSETENDFPRVKLKYIKELGKGWFGKVVEGAAQDITSNHTWTPVVVRILEASASSKERVLFLQDASIYRGGPHPNVLSLLGKCLDTVPLLLLQEYCAAGDLKAYLRQNRGRAEKFLATEYPLMWCCQLTSALKHLHENGITHPDLATRNCHLTPTLALKLGDYGLAPSHYPADYYQGTPTIPVRWCAPESLHCTPSTIQPKKLTAEANVWSLGVSMWEICECGEQPYSGMSDDEVVSKVFGGAGVRLGRPRWAVLYTDYIFRLMQLCWTNAESRPSVSQIDLMLSDLLQVHKNTKHSPNESHISADDFDKRWESLKPNKTTGDPLTEISDSEVTSITKPLSLSLNNLHGSLDNLTESSHPMESWLENVATKTSDISYIRGLSDAMKDLDNALALENTSSDSSLPESKIDFELGPSGVTSNQKPTEAFNQNDSLTDSMIYVQRMSSESDTEEENWRKKVERGAYTEKVRLKSRSVADLMVLTHVDYSESESETPLHSLDYKSNKSIRATPKNNLESVSLTFSSEGNLLNLQDTFQEELKKLQVVRRDSLLFVPDNHSGSVKTDSGVNLVSPSQNNLTELIQELNSPVKLKPANQIYNVFNVTIDKYSPVRVNSDKLKDIIGYGDSERLNGRCSLEKRNSESKSDLGYSGSDSNTHFEENISEAREYTYPSVVDEKKEEKVTETRNDNLVQKIEAIHDNMEDLEKQSKELSREEEHRTLPVGNQEKTEEIPKDHEEELMPKEELKNMYKATQEVDEHCNEIKLEEEKDLETLEKTREIEESPNEDNKELRLKENTNKMENSGQTELINKVPQNKTIVLNGDSKDDKINIEVDIRMTPNEQHLGRKEAEIKNAKVKTEDTADTAVLVDSLEKEATTQILGLNRDKKNKEICLKTEENQQLEITEKLNINEENEESCWQTKKDELVIEENVLEHKIDAKEKFEEQTEEELKDNKTEENLAELPTLSNGKSDIIDDTILEVNTDVEENSSDDKIENEEILDVEDKYKVKSTIQYNLLRPEKDKQEFKKPDTENIKCDIINEGEEHPKNIGEEITENVTEKLLEHKINEDETSKKNETNDLRIEDEEICEKSEDQLTTRTCNINEDIVHAKTLLTGIHTNGNECFEQKLDSEETFEVKNDVSPTEKPNNVDSEVKHNQRVLTQQNVMKIQASEYNEKTEEKSHPDLKENENITQVIDQFIQNEREDNIEEKSDLPKQFPEERNAVEENPPIVLNEHLELKNLNKTDDEKLQNLNKNLEDSFAVPKLSDIIQNNDMLMDFIIAKYDNDNTDNDSDKDHNIVDQSKNSTTTEDKKDILESTNVSSVEDAAETNKCSGPRVAFDLSHKQDEAMPNSLTHSTVFTSTPFGKKQELSLPSQDVYSSLNLFGAAPASDGEEELTRFSSNFPPLDDRSPEENKDLNYSLETWDNFLGKTFDTQQQDNENLNLFDSFSSEPQSLLFLENDDKEIETEKKNDGTFVVLAERKDGTFVKEDETKNGTFVREDKNDGTFVLEEKKDGTFVLEDKKDGTFVLDDAKDAAEEKAAGGSWERGGGWFLHPQSNSDHLSGEIEMRQPNQTDSYVGFSMDDEIMAAIRNELLQKLPHAQGGSGESLKEEEWDSADRNEVFLRYNVYNTRLSPILEESYCDEEDMFEESTPKQQTEEDDSDWSEEDRCEPCENLPQDTQSHTNDSPIRCSNHRHDTPSQDSCCSNDTLFNLEELLAAEKDKEESLNNEENTVIESNKNVNQDINKRTTEINSNQDNLITPSESDKNGLSDFLVGERNHSSRMADVKIVKTADEATVSNNVLFLAKQVAPLPSPEDKPWKQLPASLLSYDKVISNTLLPGNIDRVIDDGRVTEHDTVIDDDRVTEDDIVINGDEVNNVRVIDDDDDGVNNVRAIDNDGVVDDYRVTEDHTVIDGDRVNEDDIVIDDDRGNNIRVIDGNDGVNNVRVIDDDRVVNDDRVTEDDTVIDDDVVTKDDLVLDNNEGNNIRVIDDDGVNNVRVIDVHRVTENDTVIDDDRATKDDFVIDDDGGNNIRVFDDGVIDDDRVVDDDRASEDDRVTESHYENVPNLEDEPKFGNCDDMKPIYENVDDINDIYNEADYVNIVNLENSKNAAGFLTKDDHKENEYVNGGFKQHEDLIMNNETEEESDIFGVLTDIRFNGPIDSQLMSTSFSESNDIDDPDWDSGSDTRSSSSGEFIWKEGEHEESLKALRAAPQDLEDVKPMEGITEETTSESEVGTSSSDEDGETPEFVPSAWDKYATPTKSALRSPEKTLEKPEKSEQKKPKGVWFKKQKYHCVYEYPREPESPVLHSQDLWKPQPDYSSFADWEFDADTYLPPPTDDSDSIFHSINTYKPKSNTSRNHLYQITSISDFPSNSGIDDEFFISSSARPFDIGNLSSQFFPGNSASWAENVTPDSGMEDITPGSLTDDFPNTTPPNNPTLNKTIQPLRKLASEIVNRDKQLKSNDVLGGLRHTRNKLKLDLPPSPSAFTSQKAFTVEPQLEPVVIRDKPTFSTFGKSRFLVQHVDTPSDDASTCKNVSFEALPYKPIQERLGVSEEKENSKNNSDVTSFEPLEKHIVREDFDKEKVKVEFVRGEASLLDSADEDSGIESSTLERKISSAVE